MPRSSLLLCTALVALAATALAQESTTTSTIPEEVQVTTEVQGDVPQDLVGRWLVVAHVKLTDGKRRPFARALEIRRNEKQLEVILPREMLPPKLNDHVNAAIEKNAEWTPAPEDLREVADKWGTLEQIDTDLKSVQNKIIAPSNYPPEFNDDEDTKGTLFAISTQENYSGRRGALRSYTLYGLREHTPTTLGGSFVTTTIAAAPIPIPITLKGDFKAYRLESSAPKAGAGSWFQRLFSGCAR